MYLLQARDLVPIVCLPNVAQGSLDLESRSFVVVVVAYLRVAGIADISDKHWAVIEKLKVAQKLVHAQRQLSCSTRLPSVRHNIGRKVDQDDHVVRNAG